MRADSAPMSGPIRGTDTFGEVADELVAADDRDAELDQGPRRLDEGEELLDLGFG
jgi:hypothetical protein